MIDILKSKQFGYATVQAIISLAIVACLAFGPVLVGAATIAYAGSVFLGGAVPVLRRLNEGIEDAQRDQSGAVLPRDVTANAPVRA